MNAQPQAGHRTLVIAHGHPDFSIGGAEIAAYNLFKAYQGHKDVGDAWFLARGGQTHPPSGAISLWRHREYLWEQGTGDFFFHRTVNLRSWLREFSEFLRSVAPDVVHVHHYLHLGLEFLRVIRRANPRAHLFLTLHEYFAICHSSGQMVKRDSFRLCSRESPLDCNRCFPEYSTEDFWLRKQYIRRAFDLVDHFISPSHFLRQRYIDWGIAPERISVIENGQADFDPLPPRPITEGEVRNRFAFFGQINEFKGLDVLLEALRALPKASRKSLIVEIHGTGLETQSEAFRNRIEELRAPLVKQGVVRWVGPYQPADVGRRMSKIDWVLVPSLWWENSPMVIQEAFTHGRPVICANIGGMAEKVRDGIDGLHFEARNPLDLADTLLRAMEPGMWDRLRERFQPSITYKECAASHLALLTNRRSSRGSARSMLAPQSSA